MQSNAIIPKKKTKGSPDFSSIERKRLRRKLARISNRLEAEWGTPSLGNKEDPLDEVIFIMLAQRTMDASYSRVFDELKNRYPQWDNALKASIGELEKVIRPAGLSEYKAPRLKAILSKVKKDFGVLNLDALKGWSDDKVIDYLTSLNGTGLKSALCVMIYSLNRDVFPVDTHVIRIFRRLGILKESMRHEKAQSILPKIIPRGHGKKLHVNLVIHGRNVCKRMPNCDACCIRNSCDYYRMVK